MANLLIKYNKKSYNWSIYINKYLFFTFFIKNKNKINIKNFSRLSFKYLILLKILRAFGLIKSLKNFKDY